jgi:hypothetical protein
MNDKVCTCVLNCAHRQGLGNSHKVAELLLLREEAKQEVNQSRARFEKVKLTLNSEAGKLDSGCFYAVPGGVLFKNRSAGEWQIRPLTRE